MFENLISEMELHYFDKTGQPGTPLYDSTSISPNPSYPSFVVVASPEVGKLYAAQVASDWHRVRVMHILDNDSLADF